MKKHSGEGDKMVRTKVAAKKKNEINMLEGPLFGKIFLFTLPIIASGILQILFNAADLIVVGRFESSLAVGAVGATSSLTNLIVALFLGLSVGAGAAVSMAVGARRQQEASDLVHSAMALALLSGTLLAIAGWFLAPTMLAWMNTDPLILGKAALYLRIYFLGAPALLIYNTGYSIMRGLGDTTRPLIYLLISGITNVILNVIFVVAFGLGVAGVAIATVASLVISAVLVTVALMRYENACRLRLPAVRMHPRCVAIILRIGIPAGVQALLFGVSNALLQASVNGFGAAATAGVAAASSLEGIAFISMSSFSAAATAFTGQNYGARHYARIRRVMWICLIYETVLGTAVSLFMLLIKEPLLLIYLPNAPDALPYATQRMVMVLSLYGIYGIGDALLGVLRGIDVSLVPTVGTVGAICGSRLLWIFLVFPLPAFHTVTGLYGCYPISWFLAAVFNACCMGYYFRRRCPKEKEVPEGQELPGEQEISAETSAVEM